MKKIIIILAALCSYFNLAIAQSQLQTYSVYDVNHNNEVKVDDAVAVANRAIGNTEEESQVVDAAAINSVLKTIKGKLEAIETRISVIEETLGEETPAPTKHVYVGMVDGKSTTFPGLSTEELIANATKYTDNISNLPMTKQMLYFLIPEGNEFTATTLSENFVTDWKAGDNLYDDHADVTYDGITYKVHMLRFVTPEGTTFNLNFK